MRRNRQKISAGGSVLVLFILLNAIALKQGWASHPNWYWLLWVSIPLLVVSVVVFRRRKW